jgi:hypothetical protein
MWIPQYPGEPPVFPVIGSGDWFSDDLTSHFRMASGTTSGVCKSR